MASLFRLAVDKFNSTAGSVRDWASRNRRKIVIAAIVSGSAALIVYLVRGKLHQIQQPKEEDKREVAREKLRLHQYFSNVQKSCNSIIIKEIVPNLQQKLIELVPIPSKAALRAALKGTSQEKLAIWQEAQVQSLTRVICAIYAISLHLLFSRISVNILGRYMYMDTVLASETSTSANEVEEEKPISSKIQQKYLSLSNSGYILDKGLSKLVEYIKSQVAAHLETIPLTKKLNLEDVAVMLLSIRNNIETLSNPLPHIEGSKFREFLMENTIVPDFQLQVLLNETRDVLDSGQFDAILKSCVDEGFKFFISNFRNSFATSTKSNDSQSSPLEVSASLPFAKIGPIIKKQFKKVLEVNENGEKEILTNLILNKKEVQEYSYYVFTSSYDEE